MSKLVVTAISSLIAGGLFFGSALTNAGPGHTPPTPPTPPTAPTPPTPPTMPKGIKVKIQDGQIQIDGAAGIIDTQINRALQALEQDHNIPPQVREKLRKHLEKVRDKAKKRIIKMKITDVDQLGEELGRMGEEIGEEMEEYGKEMEKWGKRFEKQMGKDFERQFAKQWKQHADDEDDDLPQMPDVYEQDDVDDAMRDLGALNLKPDQRARLKQLRDDSDRNVANAKRELEKASDALQRQLENPSSSEQQIAQQIDTVTRFEADIRKARILAWVKARRVLDDAQRHKVESVAKGRRK